jgi:hypothetical protein
LSTPGTGKINYAPRRSFAAGEKRMKNYIARPLIHLSYYGNLYKLPVTIRPVK